MYRILLLISLLPIVVSLVLTWWNGTRVLWSEGKRKCRCDLGRWMPEPDDEKSVHRAEKSSNEFGAELRNKALAHWKEQSPKLAATRENNRRFGLAVPPLSGVVAIFGVVVGRVPPFGGITIFVAATAISAVLGLLSLPSELTAIQRYIKRDGFKGSFPNSYDEESVIACAMGHAWEASLPPILKWFKASK